MVATLLVARESDYMVRALADKIGCAIVSVDYRLAPEFPYPTPLEDCYAALLWLAKNTEKLNVDITKIAIGGISAGGGLAAGLALMARERAEVNVIFQLLLCPMLDDRNCLPSTYSVTDKRTWTRDSNRRGWQAYLGDLYGSDDTPIFASAF